MGPRALSCGRARGPGPPALAHSLGGWSRTRPVLARSCGRHSQASCPGGCAQPLAAVLYEADLS